ncbi:MAG: hypothetical protein A2520_05370 [Deltaproteobacteria bacterium RIFOXYD12_FULL_53_23]|nr:MAG: hypothetical protein A2520_05370 [Deltaproteobacteria bacterium RIFOXYD12_FULL_53_23]
MPTISMFYGIIICLYFYDNERHKLPHIHAKYQGYEAAFSIIDGALLAGEIPISKTWRNREIGDRPRFSLPRKHKPSTICSCQDDLALSYQVFHFT